ncbi:thioredoxin domain-containing protein [Maribacter sp. ACAM166]|uniref:thioredoxin domain-containing protein n=1 Tax=Maribacter sp. ACAM166 TaxID=2508996 RepID=UPI0010FF6249|nr:thioredoxin domain-containing protein [Maribacter sp. ACAM166]TLP79784.1 thioredoxin domain-containing protein [Maribacter sp. ACAM166]
MKIIKQVLVVIYLVFLGSCGNDGSKMVENNGQEKIAIEDFDYTNDLIHETSPYLLQHAHNPVDWKPWADSTFKNAAKKNRLVVLSIGYSTCHWCHVMEEESFEDLEVARLMNEKFVSIKVDREERPDLDMVYQTALQLVNGTGGWPMNAIILPNGSPVYLGTYHTKEEWKSILIKFSTEFEKNPDKMKEYATMLANGVQEVYEQPAKQLANSVTPDKISKGVKAWSKSWDLEWGGTIGQQKFIIPTNLNMLLEYSVLQQNEDVMSYVFKTLNKVSQGGIYDHVGGGFFRYSTDSKWKVPHFEKMLYDNAQMMGILSKAFKINGDKAYGKMVEETFAFLKTEMRNEEGGYFSAMDADTNGEEGLYYVWKKNELQSILGDDFELFSTFYEIKTSEVWENENFVLFNTLSVADFSKQESISKEVLENKIKNWKTILYEARQKRLKPSKDYKIITSWNALLIDGLVEAFKTFKDENYLTEAKLIFEYLESNNYKNKQLVHSYTTDSKQKEVFLEDYALLAKSAISLYEVTLDVSYLNSAKELMNSAISKYSSDSGLFYYNVASKLVPKIINTSDGVVPSANAIMAQNLFKLGHLEYNTEYLEDAKLMGSLLIENFENQAVSYGTWGSLLLNQAYPFYEIAIVGTTANNLIAEMGSMYLANSLLVGSAISSDIALFKDRYSVDGTFIYVCQNNTCKLPVRTVKEAYEQMKSFGYKGFDSTQFNVSF